MVNYRPDIDGLRGIAIASVLLFHAGVPGLANGFVGVDIFFVISGFLITSIILRECEAGTFDFEHFYQRRIRRIFPALFVVLASCIAPAYVLLPPSELRVFAASLLSAIFFGSNFYFWSKTGYFDSPADTHPLLHTWSLAIEEQFYLIFPILLVIAARRLRDELGLVLVGLAGVSLAVGVVLSVKNPDAAFYFSPARIWELLIGSIIALRWLPGPQFERTRDSLAFLGLALVVVSITLPPTGIFGLTSLFACLGAALIIHAGISGPTLVAATLSSPIPVVTGKLSYSLYLWHWPIIVFAKIYLARALTGVEIAGLIVATVAISAASYRFIEQPYRRPNGVFAKRGLYASAAATVVGLGALSAVAIVQNGFPQRFNKLLEFGAPEPWKPLCLLNNQQPASDWVAARCLTNAVAGPTVLLWGDSFAAHYFPAFLARGAAVPFNVLLYSLEACQPLIENQSIAENKCSAFNQAVKGVIAQHNIKTVIVAGNWEASFGAGGKSPAVLTNTVNWLRQQGVNVAVIGQTAHFKVSVPQIYWWRMQRGELIQPDLEAEPGHALNAKIQPALNGTPFFQPSLAMCTEATCTIGEGRAPFYGDGRHFTNSGSSRAMAPFWPTLEALVGHSNSRHSDGTTSRKSGDYHPAGDYLSPK
jgi:peptidoglycan/LPS O-acetylase OafA/YrhL